MPKSLYPTETAKMPARRKPRNPDDIVPFTEPWTGAPTEASTLQRKAALRVLELTKQLGGVDRFDEGGPIHKAFLSNPYAAPWKSFEPEMGHLHNAVALGKAAQARRLHAQAAKKKKE